MRTLTPNQAIRLAVEWGDATITRKQLQESRPNPTPNHTPDPDPNPQPQPHP